MSDHKYVPVIGLVGGIGSGKSSLARWLSHRRNVVIIDGDQVGHEVLNIPQVKDQIRHRFQNSVFDKQGAVNRAALGREVFGKSPQQRQARADLEKIVHPKIRDDFQEHIRQAKASKDVEAVILDAAVLLEAGWDDLCDLVVFVDAPDQYRRVRVSQDRGWNEEELHSRESSQFKLEEKRRAATHLVDNSRTLEKAGADFEHIVAQLVNDPP